MQLIPPCKFSCKKKRKFRPRSKYRFRRKDLRKISCRVRSWTYACPSPVSQGQSWICCWGVCLDRSCSSWRVCPSRSCTGVTVYQGRNRIIWLVSLLTVRRRQIVYRGRSCMGVRVFRMLWTKQGISEHWIRWDCIWFNILYNWYCFFWQNFRCAIVCRIISKHYFSGLVRVICCLLWIFQWYM